MSDKMLIPLLFYVFAFLSVLSGVMVVSAKNPVHSILFLIFCFFNAAGLFVLLGAEYLAMTLVIVYVGAVAVLFLFVVMMLDINFAELKAGFLRYLPFGGAVAAIMFVQLFLILQASTVKFAAEPTPVVAGVKGTNAEAIGHVLYTQYAYPFIISGAILLVAMIGAIVLTLRHRPGVRRQNIRKQVHRNVADSVSMVKVKSGKGI
jgi:NADH-quinone oxidoreductase subunit J